MKKLTTLDMMLRWRMVVSALKPLLHYERPAMVGAMIYKESTDDPHANSDSLQFIRMGIC